VNNNYYLTLLVKTDLPEKTRTEIIEAAKKGFAVLKKEELWGERDLAYPIQHEKKAYYAHFEFEGDPATIPSLDKSLRLNEDIIRYLLLRVETKSSKK